MVQHETAYAAAITLKETADVLQMRPKPFSWHQRESQCSRAQCLASMYDKKVMLLRFLSISPKCVDMQIATNARQGGPASLFDLNEDSHSIPNYHARMKAIHAIRKSGQPMGMTSRVGMF